MAFSETRKTVGFRKKACDEGKPCANNEVVEYADLHLCLNCRTGFATKKSLENHKKSKCSKYIIKPYGCTLCSKNFITLIELNKHILSHLSSS
ncbi:hypothetical protein KM043_007715 [Ampulex compressa]|nr:hypothetical protein KM043_007715 [Ampulex compressa]